MYQNLISKKVYIYTLGCKVNQYESDAMMEALEKEGCISLNPKLNDENQTNNEKKSANEVADICIINTCSVTNMADRKSRQIINRMRKENPGAVIAATGCYVQAAADELLEKGIVDLIIGNNRKKDVCRLVSEYLSNGHAEDNYIDVNKDPDFENLSITVPETHTRAYVKIQDGCNNFCTYCIIPYLRGRIKSKNIVDVLSEVTTLAENHVKEVVLTGINLSSYDDDETDAKLKDVICRVSKIEGIERIRLGSLEPRVITHEFLEAVSALPNFCPQFHLSLQSACDNTLKAMNRKYTIKEYADTCDLIRQYFDRPAITTDVIVGFPGETDEDFDVTYNNLVDINLYEMHVFKYSRRAGTVADKMPNQIDERIKSERSDRLIELTTKQQKAYEESFKGEDVKVLVEEIITKDDKSYFRGHTERYILVDTEVTEYLKANNLPEDTDVNQFKNQIITVTY